MEIVDIELENTKLKLPKNKLICKRLGEIIYELYAKKFKYNKETFLHWFDKNGSCEKYLVIDNGRVKVVTEDKYFDKAENKLIKINELISQKEYNLLKL